MTTYIFRKGIYCLFLLHMCNAAVMAHGVVVVKQTGKALDVRRSYVNVDIDNQISIVTSSQTYYNTSGRDINIKYAFPLPANSNPINLRWKINNDDWQEAQVNASTQNTNLPSSGSGGGGSGTGSTMGIKDYLGDNALYFSPQDTILVDDVLTMEITYVELLTYSSGQVSFHYPNDYSFVQSTAFEVQSLSINLISERTIETFDFMGSAPTLMDVQSNNATADFDEENNLPVEDIDLTYQLSSDGLGVTALSTYLDTSLGCDSLGNGFVSMIIEPESNQNVDIIEKNFTLVIDRSGSMDLDMKMEQAKEAASFIVNNLNEGDYFNIISFSSDVTSLFDSHQLYDDITASQALFHINTLRASGATNISSSLTEAISQFGAVEEDKANIIIFFTDGIATRGIEDTDLLVSAVSDEVDMTETGIFLFTFGIGEDVDKRLLTLLAIENRGLVEFLENDNLTEEVTDFFLKVNNPVLIDTEIEMVPNIITDIFPSPNRLPNLYKGEQLIVSGRYTEADSVMFTLKGQAFNLDVEYSFNINLADTAIVEKSFLPRIWAKQKLDALTLDFYLETDDQQAALIEEEIDSLSVCYNVISLEFNSFSDGTLEIELLSFDAMVTDGNEVELTWTTAMEVNNDHFIIQRSADGREWSDIGRVEGNGTTSRYTDYTYVDKHPLSGVSYYRFRQVDGDGRYSFSEMRAVIVDAEGGLLVYPNPLPTDHKLNVLRGNDEVMTVHIFDLSGRLMHNEQLTDRHTALDVSFLRQGIYLVELQSSSTKETLQIVIE